MHTSYNVKPVSRVAACGSSSPESKGILASIPYDVDSSASSTWRIQFFVSLLFCLRSQSGHLGLAADGHHSHLTRSVNGHDHLQLAIALEQRNVPDFRSVHR